MAEDPYVNRGGLVTRNIGAINRSIASLSGSDQTLMEANPLRKAFHIQNTGTSLVTMSWLTAGATENASGVYELLAGESISSDRMINRGCTPVSAITVKGTAGQSLHAEEWLIGGV
jgi:hypothetical protein